MSDQRADYERAVARARAYAELRTDVRELRDEVLERARGFDKKFLTGRRDLCRQMAKDLDKILKNNRPIE